MQEDLRLTHLSKATSAAISFPRNTRFSAVDTARLDYFRFPTVGDDASDLSPSIPAASPLPQHVDGGMCANL